MKNTFKDILKGKIVIVGIGNTMRGDDGFGPALIENLKGEVNAVCIDAGTSPENYLGKIAKENPDTIIFADAVHLGLTPGAYEMLKGDEILNCGLITHDISPKMLIDYLKEHTEADIYLLGIQPKDISFGSEMSSVVRESAKEIAAAIKEIINA